jgi:peptide deformylase
MKIVQAPQQVLSQKAKPVTKIDSSIKNLISEMEVTLNNARDPEGVGLAAPQVGKSLRLFIVKQTPKSPFMTFINPEIERMYDNPTPPATKTPPKKKKDNGVQLEGCLSLKDIWGVVKRYDNVVVTYKDEHGEKHKKTFEGFTATIIQHEVDHLDGKLFTVRVIEQGNQLYKSSENAKGETEFEEIEI